MKDKIKSFFKNKQNIKKLLLVIALFVILVASVIACIFYNKYTDFYLRNYASVYKLYRSDDTVVLYLNDGTESLNLSIGNNRQNFDFLFDDGSGKLSESNLKEFFMCLSNNKVKIKFKDFHKTCIIYEITDKGVPSFGIPNVMCKIIDNKLSISLDVNADGDVSVPLRIDLKNGSVTLSGSINNYDRNSIEVMISKGDTLVDLSNKDCSNLNQNMLTTIKNNIYNLVSDIPNEDYFDSILNSQTEVKEPESEEENLNKDSEGFVELPNELDNLDEE